MGGSSHQSIFFCKFGFISLKQSDNRTAEFFAILGNLLTGNRTVNELVFNRLAVIDCNLNSFGILSRIAESKRILTVGEDIMLIGCKLLYIVASERKVGFDNCLAVFGKRDNLNQTVCRDRSTACGNKLLGGKSPKLIFFTSSPLPILKMSFFSIAFSRLTVTFCLSFTKLVAVSVWRLPDLRRSIRPRVLPC